MTDADHLVMLVSRVDVRAGVRNDEPVASVLLYDSMDFSREIVMSPQVALELAVDLVKFVQQTTEWTTPGVEDVPLVDRSR